MVEVLHAGTGAIDAGVYRERFENAIDFETFIAAAEKNAELWREIHRRARVPADIVEAAGGVPGRWKLLVLAEEWCGDAVNIVGAVAAFADAAENVELRIVGREANPDLMNAHLTAGTRSIPVVIALDESFHERGWWGPRPGALQTWFTEELRALAKDVRYPLVRQWYARDRGRTTFEEMVALLRRAAAERDEALEAA